MTININIGNPQGPAGPAGAAVPIAANTILANATNATATPIGINAATARLLLSINNVDNTSDANKPISTATQTALNGKAQESHNHSASQITSGTLANERLPSNVILVGADGFPGVNLNATTGVCTWGQLESADSWGQLSWDNGKAIIASVTRLTLQASYLDVECTVTKLIGELSFIPASSVSLSTNGQLGFWKVSDTQLGLALRGSDGTTRTTILTLS
jgi:hypothetical protein